MTGSPPPEEQKKIDAEAKAKEDAEQAALPYKWTQTIKDVDITISIPGNLKGRDLNVKFTKKKLFAAIKGQDAFIDVCLLLRSSSATEVTPLRATSPTP
jgi:HSP20 family molecular chaperone IbpA